VFSNGALNLAVAILSEAEALLGGLHALEDIVDVGGLLLVALVHGSAGELVCLFNGYTALLDNGVLGFKLGLDAVLVVGRLFDGVVDRPLGFESFYSNVSNKPLRKNLGKRKNNVQHTKNMLHGTDHVVQRRLDVTEELSIQRRHIPA
jgi:hypothetical protein